MKKKLFNFLTFSLFSFFPLLAATTPLASTNDYYFTTPKTTNICGRVMGENGDYKLVRAEDLAFINEAWAERMALANVTEKDDAVPGGPLVAGGHGGQSTRWYWNRAQMRECVLTNMPAHPVTEASGGAMTNIFASVTNAARGKLVTRGALTNMFATLKKMDCLVWRPYASSTGIIERVSSWWSQADDEEPSTGTNRTVFPLASFGGFYEQGSGSILKEQLTVETSHTYKNHGGTRANGSGTVRLEMDVADTNAWLRGQGRPKVVREARAWCAVSIASSMSETTKRDGQDPDETSASTNALVMVDLGEARWGGATTGSKLVYEVDVDVRKVYEKCRNVAPWIYGLSEVEAWDSVPSLSGYGTHARSKDTAMTGAEYYLIMWLKPMASVNGW